MKEWPFHKVIMQEKEKKEKEKKMVVQIWVFLIWFRSRKGAQSNR